MISAVKNEYNINSTRDYVELINTIIDDVLEERYSIQYGLACTVRIFKIFSDVVGQMEINIDDKENITNIVEVYMSVDFLYKQYINNNVMDEKFIAELNFPFIPKGCKIVSLIYMGKLNEWGCTYSGWDEEKLKIKYNENILDLFRDIFTSK